VGAHWPAGEQRPDPHGTARGFNVLYLTSHDNSWKDSKSIILTGFCAGQWIHEAALLSCPRVTRVVEGCIRPPPASILVYLFLCCSISLPLPPVCLILPAAVTRSFSRCFCPKANDAAHDMLSRHWGSLTLHPSSPAAHMTAGQENKSTVSRRPIHQLGIRPTHLCTPQSKPPVIKRGRQRGQADAVMFARYHRTAVVQ
jgi:hypothetical protein